MDAGNVIHIVAGLVMNDDGQVLLVRKRGTTAFMQPGGKIVEGEAPLDTLDRELREELGCGHRPGSERLLGTFSAPAANEPGFMVEAQLFAVSLDGRAEAHAEIEEATWADPAAPGALDLAPLTAFQVLPLAGEMKDLLTQASLQAIQVPEEEA